MQVLGVDPGFEGALALLNADGTLAALVDIPSRPARIEGTMRPRIVSALLRDAIRAMAPGHAVVARIEPQPADGPRAAEMLRAAGQVDGVLAGLDIAVLPAEPRVWRAAMKVSVRRGTYEQRKQASRTMAFRLWPTFSSEFGHVERGADRAEAALIAAWGLRFGGLGKLARAA
jgi:hypothetical protein